MTAKQPPVPPRNRSDKGTGDNRKPSTDKADRSASAPDPDKQGQEANTKVNTTHQGFQQDR
ncbi:hypothetical protein [Rhizobium cauense]|uniref:hypothetical protein n=1 Tax=Rhizobium cauense TaxID=1166683 RepID=UPI001CB79302|nr:hypothetical protein [Rhizobium cauense]